MMNIADMLRKKWTKICSVDYTPKGLLNTIATISFNMFTFIFTPSYMVFNNFLLLFILPALIFPSIHIIKYKIVCVVYKNHYGLLFNISIIFWIP